MARILFLDDDVFQTNYNVDELRKKFDVERRSNVDQALGDFVRIRREKGPWAGAVLDIMMPPGQFMHESPDGMQTGWHVFKKLRELQPDLPVIIITNLGKSGARDWFGNEGGVEVLNKVKVLPDELVRIAKKLFSGSLAAEA